MQKEVDTYGYIMRGIRKACGDIKKAVRRREAYFIYYNKQTKEVLVNVPSNNHPELLLVLECGTYELSQQEIADLVLTKLTP